MRAVQRLKGLGWLAGCVAVVLACYLVSLSVAAERNKLDAVNVKIVQAQRDLRALNTEFNARANYAQLESYNAKLAMAVPGAGQYVRDAHGLARGPGHQPEIRMAALVVPAGAMPIETANAQALASVAHRPAGPGPVAQEAVAIEHRPQLIQAVATRSADDQGARTPRKVALLDEKLLDDLLSGARAEAARRR